MEKKTEQINDSDNEVLTENIAGTEEDLEGIVDVQIATDSEIKDYISSRSRLDYTSALGVLKAAFLWSEIGLDAKGKTLSFTFKNIFAAMMFSEALKIRIKYSLEMTLNIPTDGRRSRSLSIVLPENISRKLLRETQVFELDNNGDIDDFTLRIELTEAERNGFFCLLYLEKGKLSFYDDYRLEFNLGDSEKCKMISEILKAIEIKSGITDNNVLLLRTTAIYYYFALCEANRYSLMISEFYLIREQRHKFARRGNFDAANYDKAATAAAYQRQAISILREKNKLSLLSPERLELAIAREKNPEASLLELAKLLGISKSTAFHRMKAITDLAEEYK